MKRQKSDSRNGTTTNSEKNPDEVMLNPEYLRKAKGDADKPLLGRRLSKEEMDAVFRERNTFFGIDSGLDGGSKTTVRPYFALKSVINRSGKAELIPVVGIQGTF